MREPEPYSDTIMFRVEPSRKRRWRQAARDLGHREFSDYLRVAVDGYTDAALETLPPQATPDPKGKP